ncbi:MAG: hypothetical protein ACM3TR_04435 [Caulobacteraceae bacterium]
MNEKTVDILKYFFLTFVSLELMYFIAKSRLNLLLVLLVSVAFAILYALDKYKVLIKLFSVQQKINENAVKKDQVM